MKVFVLLILGMACLANAQLKSSGTCPTFNVQKNFDVAKYMGRWFEYSKYVNDFQKDATCSSADYTDITKSGGAVVIDVLNRQKEPTKGLVKATGNATLGDPDNAEKPAKLVVNFFGARPTDKISTTTNYNVIETDYTSYSIVYFCRQVSSSEKSEFLWILTRQRVPAMTITNAAVKKIQDEGIDTTRLTKQVQTDCPEIPNSSNSVTSSVGFLAALSAMLMVRNFF